MLSLIFTIIVVIDGIHKWNKVSVTIDNKDGNISANLTAEKEDKKDIRNENK